MQAQYQADLQALQEQSSSSLALAQDHHTSELRSTIERYERYILSSICPPLSPSLLTSSLFSSPPLFFPPLPSPSLSPFSPSALPSLLPSLLPPPFPSPPLSFFCSSLVNIHIRRMHDMGLQHDSTVQQLRERMTSGVGSGDEARRENTQLRAQV